MAVEFGVLGPLTVWVDDSELSVRAAKQRHLLGVLLLRHPHPVPADRLIEELWPDGPPDDPIASLRVLVSRLRRRLEGARTGPTIRSGPGSYLLETAPEHIDAHRFVAHVDAGATLLAAGRPRDAAAEYRAGLSLWRGEVCADLPLGVGLAAAVGDLEARHLAALTQCAEAELAVGHHQRLVAELQELTVRYPEDEALGRHLMVALSRCGRQAEALRVGGDLRRRLSAAGLPVSTALAEVEAAILAPTSTPAERSAVGLEARSDPSGPDRPGVPTRVPVHRRPPPLLSVEGPFIGRDHELNALELSIRRARSGGLQIAWLEGVPGSGKSHLAAVAAQEASAQGWTVLVGGCEERRRPFHPLRVALEPLLDGLTARERAPLAAFDPAARGHPASSPAAARIDAFERVAALVRAAAKEDPVMVVLDDAHWIDPASAAALRHLVGALRGAAVAVVLTARPGEERADPHPDPLSTGSATTRIELRPWTFDDVLRLVTEIQGRPPVAAERRGVHSVWARSGGNPYLASEWARDLVASGQLGRVSDRDEALPIDLPTAAGALVDLRMAGLRAHERNVLEAAAVHAMETPIEILEAVVGDADLVGGAIAAASRSRLVCLPSRRPAPLAFCHALVREALVADLPATRLMFLHDRIATVLEGAGAERHGPDLAFHALASAALDPRRAVVHAERAAREAFAGLGFEEAERLYRRCAELLADGAAVTADLAAAVASGLAECVSAIRADERGST